MLKKKGDFMTLRNRLIQLSYETDGDYLQMYRRIKQDPTLTAYHAKQAVVLTNVVTILDENYPAVFKQLQYPPLVLYYEGDFSLLNRPTLGIIGSLKPTELAVSETRQFLDKVDSSYALVSLVEQGISFVSFECFRKRGAIIGVMASGLERKGLWEVSSLFRQNTYSTCLVSEYPKTVQPTFNRKRERLRLMLALSEQVICIEPRCDELAMPYLLQETKPLYVMPRRLGDEASRGTFLLLEQGAFCLPSFQWFSEK